MAYKDKTKCELIHGDCAEVLKTIPNNTIDCVITSPPYDNIRTYENTLDWSFEKFTKIADELSRTLKQGGG